MQHTNRIAAFFFERSWIFSETLLRLALVFSFCGGGALSGASMDMRCLLSPDDEACSAETFPIRKNARGVVLSVRAVEYTCGKRTEHVPTTLRNMVAQERPS